MSHCLPEGKYHINFQIQREQIMNALNFTPYILLSYLYTQLNAINVHAQKNIFNNLTLQTKINTVYILPVYQ